MRTKLVLVFILIFVVAWSACAPATETSSLPTSATTPLPEIDDSATAPPVVSAVSPQPDDTAGAATYYVRLDGGSPQQCSGQVDAPYPGSGSGQPCAWDHPFRALPPGETPRIAAGDTLIIAAGSYMMGYGAPGADICESDYPWDCHMPPVPGGLDANTPTRILGAGWDSGCADPPELWGTERAYQILDLTGSSNVEIACLQITDHAGCVEDHSGGLACERENYPFGEWAATGLYAADAANVQLRDLNIHGLAAAGVRAGRITDWTVENVRIAGNGWVGWDGDIDGDDANAGTLLFRNWTVAWNGCGETYPGAEPVGCWAQSAGGYGDGVGTGETGGNWIIEDSAFLHNTSDGLDLLYARREDSTITIRRTIAEGNAGDQIKTTGPTLIENVIAASNCGFFQDKPFTYNVDNCRAGGSAIALNFRPGNQVTIVNSTITGQGDCLVIAECVESGACNGSERALLRNSIFLGNPEFGGDGDTTCLAWHGMEHDPLTFDYAVINGVKNMPDPCPANSFCGVSPGLVNESIAAFDAHLQADSLVINKGTADSAPSDDFDGRSRDSQPDIGAYEWRQASAWLYLPAVILPP